MRTRKLGLVATVFVLGVFSVGSASADVLQNGTLQYQGGLVNPYGGSGFVDLLSGSTAIPDWTVGAGTNASETPGTGVDWIGNYWSGPPVCAPNCLSVDLDGNYPGSISQTISTVNGANYTLSFWLSGNPGGAPNPKVLDVAAGGTSTIFDATGPSDFIPNWVQHSVSFTGTGNSTTITFASNTQPIGPWPQNDAFGPVVGDISLTSTTPEPGFYGLLALGLSGLLVAVTRRPRAKSPADRE